MRALFLQVREPFSLPFFTQSERGILLINYLLLLFFVIIFIIIFH